MKERKLLLALNDMDEDLLLDAIASESHQVRRIRPSVILIAAVLAGLLALSAGAAITEAGWYQLFFENESQQELTPGQIDVVQSSTTEYGQSITRDGYTITLESILADAGNCYMKVKITGPGGVPMDNEEGYGPRAPKSLEDLRIDFTTADGEPFKGLGSLTTLEDEDPNDNQVTLLYRYGVNQHTNTTFESERNWRLTIRDLAAWGGLGEEDIILVKGDVSFDITFDKLSADMLHFISEPVPYTFTLPGEAAKVEGSIIQCSLQPMSGSMTISGCQEAVDVLMLPVVMKDGTQVEMRAISWGNGSYRYTLKAPIDLDEMDHILLKNGRKLYPNAG